MFALSLRLAVCACFTCEHGLERTHIFRIHSFIVLLFHPAVGAFLSLSIMQQHNIFKVKYLFKPCYFIDIQELKSLRNLAVLRFKISD